MFFTQLPVKTKMESIKKEIFVSLDYIADNLTYFLAVTIPLTILVLVISIKYTLSNILTIWKKGKPTAVDADESDGETEDQRRTTKVTDEGSGDAGPDPVQFCEHLQSEVKKARQRVATRDIQDKLSEDDIQHEREVQRKQLEEIYKLMETQNEKFGVNSVDEIQQQMKLYA